MAASNWASWSWVGDGPSLTRPNVASRRMRRQPRSGSSAAGAGTGATWAVVWACCGAGSVAVVTTGGTAGRGDIAGRGGTGGGAGGAGWRGGGGARGGGAGGPGRRCGGAGGRGGAGLCATGGEAGGAVGASLLGGPGGRAAGGPGRSGCRRSRRNSSRSFMGSSGAGRSVFVRVADRGEPSGDEHHDRQRRMRTSIGPVCVTWRR